MTAVEFLEKELYERFHLSYLVLFNELINQAKEMEKEQIVTAHYQGYRNDIVTTEVSEQYYKQTFK